MVAEAFRYAVDNGARILVTSYNIDPLVGDPIVTAAFNYAYDRGALMFNSAGNTTRRDPVRQAFTQVLLVANTDQNDQKYDSSNYGSGIDLAAPGAVIYSTIPGGYGYMSGTSMAAPNAAGVAALIWAANPAWTRDQVAAQLLGTVDSIDAQNPLYVGLLGAGRVNASRAVTETLAPPRLIPLELPAEGTMITTPQTLTFAFHVPDVLDVATVTTSSFELRGAGPDGLFDTADDRPAPLVPADGMPYRVGTNRVSVQSASLTPDHYRFTVRSGAAGLRDPFGAALDGNGDGTSGDPITRTFSVQYQVYGLVYEDWNGNRLRDSFELPISGVTVGVDINHNDLIDTGEPQMLSDGNGLYSFMGLAAGSYTLLAIPPDGWKLGKPAEIVVAELSGSYADLGLFRIRSRSWLAFVR
jgi:subtilisin family serine protease